MKEFVFNYLLQKDQLWTVHSQIKIFLLLSSNELALQKAVLVFPVCFNNVFLEHTAKNTTQYPPEPFLQLSFSMSLCQALRFAPLAACCPHLAQFKPQPVSLLLILSQPDHISLQLTLPCCPQPWEVAYCLQSPIHNGIFDCVFHLV